MTRRLRIVYLDHVARLSGGEIALARAMPLLAKSVEAHVILAEHGPLVERLQQAGATVEVLPMSERARDARKETVRPRALAARAALDTAQYVLRLAHRLRQIAPDLVHTNSLKAAMYGGAAGRLARVPVIWHVRDRIAPDYLPRPAVRLVRGAARVLPSAVIANSRATLATLPPHSQGVVVTNAVVYDSVTEARRGLRQDDHQFRVGVVGRLAPWKGQDIFLRAVASAFPGKGDVSAWIIGDALFGEDAYVAELRRLTEQLGLSRNVDFRGFRDDVWAELAELDVLVHCSVAPEPFGQVVIEGMAAGVPVIAAAAGGPQEIITDGVDGLLSPPGDVAGLAARLRQLRDDVALRRQLSEAGLATAARYTPDRTAEQILAVYDEVLAQRAIPPSG
jgi:glycosyltransferase involved in cell wall biosynthesis